MDKHHHHIVIIVICRTWGRQDNKLFIHKDYLHSDTNYYDRKRNTQNTQNISLSCLAHICSMNGENTPVTNLFSMRITLTGKRETLETEVDMIMEYENGRSREIRTRPTLIMPLQRAHDKWVRKAPYILFSYSCFHFHWGMQLISSYLNNDQMQTTSWECI